MNVLALDGALGAISAATARDDRIVASRSETGNVALERGLGLVREVLERSQLEPEGIDRLAVGIGPGGFTGLRIAVAYAKSLAAAWRRPLVAIDSFDLLEWGGAYERALAVVSGRAGVISARLRSPDGVRRASGRIADVLGELFPAHVEGTLTVVGAAKDVLHELAERGIIVHSVDPLVLPAAAAAALAASSRAPAKSVHEVGADYGELPAATVPRL
ncbi:MAG TPA: tRNA (adenosine(37)-N6)-threonylcarbamoyltransferase complex dimerization subunit type 1 TsaB [Candidatus Binatia bacterium]|nr:tRNA (adenosine(37)-N6)-threonylcarbamoyltransferase complex dimerization subunit type 1 TsaB [Candidatus Binatia bacterium]